jgi:predicted permease
MERLLLSLFQSVTPRTAGFNTADYASMSDSRLLITIMLMMVGGAPGSTAGGMKVTTMAVLFLASGAFLRRQDNVNCFRRLIEKEAIQNAMALLTIYIFLLLVMCYEVYLHRNDCTTMELNISFGAAMGFLLIAQKTVTDDAIPFGVYYLTMAIVALQVDNIPGCVSMPLTMLGNITVPAALLIVGSSMSQLSLRDMLGNRLVYVTTLFRLVLLPVAVYYITLLLGFSDFVVNINTIVVAMPVATYGTILCLKYRRDTSFITAVTFVTTLLSMLTIPALVVLLL